jgi:hypothetical protein
MRMPMSDETGHVLVPTEVSVKRVIDPHPELVASGVHASYHHQLFKTN